MYFIENFDKITDRKTHQENVVKITKCEGGKEQG